MTVQSVVKYLLTEGDKLLIFRLSPLADQGALSLCASCSNPLERLHASPSPNICSPRHRRPVRTTKRRCRPPSNCCRPSSSSRTPSFSWSSARRTCRYQPHWCCLRDQQTSAPRTLRAFRFYLPAMAYVRGVPRGRMHARGPVRPEPHESRGLRCAHLHRARKCTRVRRRRRRTRLSQHPKHGFARAVHLALRMQILQCPRRTPPPTGD
ncbi:hypothetical protein EDB83DRAFT_953369 [Lactarius deliciosus]|nr:hypothetical protein EDB83DRAFT_953369 [Lactarius deliciosus]